MTLILKTIFNLLTELDIRFLYKIQDLKSLIGACPHEPARMGPARMSLPVWGLPVWGLPVWKGILNHFPLWFRLVRLGSKK
ncbi:MAG TPA: hypothetical protein DCX89_02010 [Saprospirales bacterium]|nr:hypothetical protein [Saprospirales bacterium]HAY70643.1 hypothetical protein [Saprospirales bacterium]HRQ28543.1 hypothetical protein [Saprospiraceae bacterium]